MDHGPWTMVHGPGSNPWTIIGPWTVLHGPWSMDRTIVHGHAPWTMVHVHGPWSVAHGLWPMVHGRVTAIVIGLSLGIKHVEAGPLVRSSYRADQQAQKLLT